MHKIQQQILQKLATAGGAKYSQLKERAMEGNLFTYHLNSLKKLGYMQSKSGLYSLTPAGKHLVDRMSFESFKERIQPKIATTIVLEDKGKYLLYRKRRAPFKGKVSFPYGKIHLEERLVDAANRELIEKTGLKAKLSHVGDVYLTIHDEMDLISHMLCHVFAGSRAHGELKTDYPGGESFWARLEDLPENVIFPGMKQILGLVKNRKKTGHFFREFFLNTTE